MLKTDLILAMEAAQKASLQTEAYKSRLSHIEDLREPMAETLAVYETARVLPLFQPVVDLFFEDSADEFMFASQNPEDENFDRFVILTQEQDGPDGFVFVAESGFMEIVHNVETNSLDYEEVSGVEDIISRYQDFTYLDMVLDQIEAFCNKVRQLAEEIVISVSPNGAQETMPQAVALEPADEPQVETIGPDEIVEFDEDGSQAFPQDVDNSVDNVDNQTEQVPVDSEEELEDGVMKEEAPVDAQEEHPIDCENPEEVQRTDVTYTDDPAELMDKSKLDTEGQPDAIREDEESLDVSDSEENEEMVSEEDGIETENPEAYDMELEDETEAAADAQQEAVYQATGTPEEMTMDLSQDVDEGEPDDLSDMAESYGQDNPGRQDGGDMWEDMLQQDMVHRKRMQQDANTLPSPPVGTGMVVCVHDVLDNDRGAVITVPEEVLDKKSVGGAMVTVWITMAPNDTAPSAYYMVDRYKRFKMGDDVGIVTLLNQQNITIYTKDNQKMSVDGSWLIELYKNMLAAYRGNGLIS